MNHSLPLNNIIQELNTDPITGLTQTQVQEAQKKYGLNELKHKPPISKWTILIRQLKSIIVLLLTIAAVVSFSLGQHIEGLSVILVLIINTIMGYMTELKAIRSMESLKNMAVTMVHVLREGKPQSVDSKQLVPGDILILEAGDMMSADARIIESSRLAVDESILTGESVPVDKEETTLSESTLLADRVNMLYKGTSLTRGTAKALVIATGMETELGKIAKLTQEAKEEVTPLEERLDKLGQQLVWVALGISIFIVLAGIIRGKDLFIMLETSLALAVAAIPEGLPIVATIALAKGMWRMAQKNALINKLSVVETLGATSVIFTDKTGTLTENKMTVELLHTKESEKKEIALKVASLCNSGELGEEGQESIGDPMELALLRYTAEQGFSYKDLEKDYPQEFEVAFDSVRKMMATVHKTANNYFIAVKGAPESLLKTCPNEEREYWQQQNKELSSQGLRLLGLAFKRQKERPNPADEEAIYQNLTMLGLIALVDPARSDIKPALLKCHEAGIRVIMITGDQEGTAAKIAKDVSLTPHEKVKTLRGDEIPVLNEWNENLKERIVETDVFSRVSPQQKLDLITFYQQREQIVAMTGDGVNDAPALKKADIGMAMGIRGTQVAKDASDMILKDDHFRTIIEGVKQGRIIFSNIRRFVVYLLSCNLSEVLIVSLASIIDAPLPLTAMQILFLNLVTDVFPALALGMGEGDDSYLKLSPRGSKESIITPYKWGLIFTYGILITISVLSIFFYHMVIERRELSIAITMSFLTLGFAQVFHIFNMRLVSSSWLKNDITKNKYIWGALALCSVLLIGVVVIPFFRQVLSLAPLSAKLWLRVLLFSLAPTIMGQVLTLFKYGIRN